MKRRIVIPPEKRPAAPNAVAPNAIDTPPRERRKLGLNYGGTASAAPTEEHAS